MLSKVIIVFNSTDCLQGRKLSVNEWNRMDWIQNEWRTLFATNLKEFEAYLK